MWNVIVPLKCRRITNLGISVTLKDVILGSTVTLKEFFWAGWLRRRRMWVWVPMRIFLCGVYMFSLCLCGFSPSTPVSSHCTKTHTFAWFGASKCSSGCESIFVSWYIELRSNLKRPYIQTVPPPQWKVRVWPQTGTNVDCWCSKHQHRQNTWIPEVFFF